MKKTLISAALCSVLATTSFNAAAVDKQALLDKIRGQSSQYSEFKALLTSPDQSVRFSAFDAMYNSGDVTLKELAIDEALAYPDATLQALALKEIIMGLDTITFQLKAPKNADEKTLEQITKLGHAKTYKLNKKDRKTGLIQECRGRSQCTGQVSGLQLTINNTYYQDESSLTATLTDGVQLTGTISYKGLMPIEVTASLK